MTDDLETFLSRVDAFAAELSPQDQARLHTLLADDGAHDVVGFGFEPPWPGLRAVAPIKIGRLMPGIANGDLGSGRISSGDLGSGRLHGG